MPTYTDNNVNYAYNLGSGIASVSRSIRAANNITILDFLEIEGEMFFVDSIDDNAFANCFNLRGVTIPDSVTSIGRLAFSGCNRLTRITMSNHLTSIGEFAFQSCSSLTSLIIPISVTSIGQYAFTGCSSLTSLEIPDSVTSIERSIIQGCQGLTSFKIPRSVTSINTYQLFSGCTSLISIDVDIQNIYYSSILGVLFNKSATKLLAYPQGLIGSYTIPNSVTSIDLNAFADCTNLTEVIIPNSVTSIGDLAFASCANLTNVIIPNSVISIGQSAFRFCVKFTKVIISNSVTSISNYAFNNCSNLAKLIIGASVTYIGNDAFNSCNKLTNVLFLGDIPTIESPSWSPNFNNPSDTASYIIGALNTDILTDLFSNIRPLTRTQMDSALLDRPSLRDLIDAGATETHILSFEYTLQELKNAGFTGSKPTSIIELSHSLSFFKPPSIHLSNNITSDQPCSLQTVDEPIRIFASADNINLYVSNKT
jgi:hypothetical protein